MAFTGNLGRFTLKLVNRNRQVVDIRNRMGVMKANLDKIHVAYAGYFDTTSRSTQEQAEQAQKFLRMAIRDVNLTARTQELLKIASDHVSHIIASQKLSQR